MDYNDTDRDVLIDSWLPTSYLASAALNCYGEGGEPMWKQISTTAESAFDYYASLPDDERRLCSAEVLAANGWTVRRVAARKA